MQAKGGRTGAHQTRSKRRLGLWLRASATVLIAGAAAGVTQAQNALSDLPPPHRRDQTAELAMKIRAPFTLVSVGDMLQMTPVSTLDDPDVQVVHNAYVWLDESASRPSDCASGPPCVWSGATAARHTTPRTSNVSG